VPQDASYFGYEADARRERDVRTRFFHDGEVRLRGAGLQKLRNDPGRLEMSMETILIVVVVLFLIGGGGYGYSRWRR
jgi:hypothetical protein